MDPDVDKWAAGISGLKFPGTGILIWFARQHLTAVLVSYRGCKAIEAEQTDYVATKHNLSLTSEHNGDIDS